MRVIVFAITLFLFGRAPSSIRKFEIAGTAQGTTYHIQYFATDSIVKKDMIDSLLKSIDWSLSLYVAGSLVNQFNHSQRGIKADEHLKAVVQKAIVISGKTQGLFDMTVYPLAEVWGFGTRSQGSIPSKRRIRQLMNCVGARYVGVIGDSVVKTRPCVKLDPNGIAQGYTADQLALLLEKYGIENYLAEIGGELRVRGRSSPGNEAFRIAIEMPGYDQWDIQPATRVFMIDSGAVTTSGSYRNFLQDGTTRRSHLIDPRTGRPVNNDLLSVTVIAKDAITADAYDNALMLMGVKRGISFVDNSAEIAARFIYRRSDGSIADTMSKNFPKIVQR